MMARYTFAYMVLSSPEVSWELSLEVFWWVTACIRQMG